MRVFQVLVVLVAVVICGRLFTLQVLAHGFYSALASDQHDIFEKLFPTRGSIYLKDPTSPSGTYPAAVNRDTTLVYAVPRDITDPKGDAQKIAPILGTDEGKLEAKLGLGNDPYEPIERDVPDDQVAKLKELDIKGIGYAKGSARYYPDGPVMSHVVGFVGENSKGERVGRYGIEGYWNDALSGTAGFLQAERDPVGRWIGTGQRTFVPAKDGADITLTIDRNIQYTVCQKLKDAVKKHSADSGSLVIMDPKTGAVLAMCSVPDFDPNDFSQVSNIGVFNNASIFDPYEPGSVFKAITMSAAIDSGAITPDTTYVDKGEVKIGPYTIHNADLKAHGTQTMTQVLEMSLNTGTIFAVQKTGAKVFRDYVHAFGFGQRTGIGLETEAPGDVSSLDKEGEIWSATASYGQGVTVTPLQLAAAYGAIADGGKLMKPYIVDKISYPDGTVKQTKPTAVRQVISKRAAALVGGMLVDVVENGEGKRAAVPGYWVAGKTGTAQIPKKNGKGYSTNGAIGSFVGFAPVDDPAFVMVVKMVRPKDVQWAESSAAPLFGDIASFLLQYMEIPPQRPVK